jgi:hypothetical protein
VKSEESTFLQGTFQALLDDGGFIRHGNTWNKHSNVSIAVFNLQRAPGSRAFYINLGVCFRALGTVAKPNEAHCHVRCRLDQIAPDRARLHDLLNFEKKLFPLSRKTELQDLVKQFGIPWLDEVSTYSGAAAYAARVPKRHPFVTPDARVLLGLVGA